MSGSIRADAVKVINALYWYFEMNPLSNRHHNNASVGSSLHDRSTSSRKCWYWSVNGQHLPHSGDRTDNREKFCQFILATRFVSAYRQQSHVVSIQSSKFIHVKMTSPPKSCTNRYTSESDIPYKYTNKLYTDTALIDLGPFTYCCILIRAVKWQLLSWHSSNTQLRRI